MLTNGHALSRDLTIHKKVVLSVRTLVMNNSVTVMNQSFRVGVSPKALNISQSIPLKIYGDIAESWKYIIIE